MNSGSDNELVVKVYNINKGRNADMVNRCSSLSGYSELVAEVEENKKTPRKNGVCKL